MRTNLAAWLAVGALAAVATAAGFALARPATAEITVYKSPTCGCCAKWVDHLRANDFTVTVQDLDDVTRVKRELGVPSALASCHTAVAGGYLIEGHVPADLIAQLLDERPKILGLAVPGMPAGSPGMEGDRKEPYDVLTFDAAGRTAVYARR